MDTNHDTLYIGCKALAKRVLHDEGRWRELQHLLSTTKAIFPAFKYGSRWAAYESSIRAWELKGGMVPG